MQISRFDEEQMVARSLRKHVRLEARSGREEETPTQAAERVADRASDAASMAPLRVAVFVTTPRRTYSGGRYNALMLAEALAQGGHDVYFVTNHRPIFFDDLSDFPHHERVNLVLTPDFRSGLPSGSFDVVVLIPGTSLPGFYSRVEIFAIERHAHRVLFNFETPNWFNALSPEPRPASDWRPWKQACRHASLVLANSIESTTWAKRFYRRRLDTLRFDHSYPPINSASANRVPGCEREDRAILFMRFSSALHKGSAHLEELFSEVLRGFTLVMILGKEEVPPDVFKRLSELAERHGMALELKTLLSDREKFAEMKRARLMLFPSYFEGFGYPPVEALYCGLSCVAFDLPVLRETCGDRIHYAKHGNWADFRAKIQQALAAPRPDASAREAMLSIAGLEKCSDRLTETFGELARTPLPRQGRSRFRLALLKWRDGLDLVARYRKARRRAGEGITQLGSRVVRRIRALLGRRHSVCYFPTFHDPVELTSHFHRACWYLPEVAGGCESVSLYTGRGMPSQPGPRPEEMCDPGSPTTHIALKRGATSMLLDLLRAELILCWRGEPKARWLRFLSRCGIPIVNVATSDLASKEYGIYCSLVWKHLTPPLERELTLAESQRRFEAIASAIATEGCARACVFGTGPSLERAHEFDYGNSLNIVCNSIVQDESLLDLLRPRFICAGDVVSHLGVSAYAARFRDDLIRALRERDLFFVTTASFGALFVFHHPELEHRVILLEQTSDDPNFDLLVHFGSPRLDSTLNIHMLPLAATFSDQVWLLGCDGKSEERSNEDFWAHAETAQYQDLVETGLACHPTFDLHRQASTYARFVASVAETVETGEREHAMSYRSLLPSRVPALASRAVPEDVLARESRPYRLAALEQRLAREPRPDEADHVDAPELDADDEQKTLPLLAGVSLCGVNPDGILKVRGWALAGSPITRIAVSRAGKFLGSANLRLARPDVALSHPAYGENRAGFQFLCRMESADAGGEPIRIEMYAGELLQGDRKAAISRIS